MRRPHLRSIIQRLVVAPLLWSVVVLAPAAGAEAAEWPTTGWETSTPEEQGMDPAALARLVEAGHAKNSDSILIVRHGKIVLDAYFAPYSAELPHVINSSTKAVVGTLAAIAVKEGVLQGLDQPLLSFFAARGMANLDDSKKAITLQHLLDMTSGLDWQEVFDNVPQSAIDMEGSASWVQYILNRPMAERPGERFNYNSGNPHLVSAILNRVTGMNTEDYARTKLFGPLGITNWKWRRDPQGIPSGGFGLMMYPRDMAKLGYLYLRRGEWEGRQLLPIDWIEKVNHAQVDMRLSFAPTFRYANFFWADPGQNAFWASGYRCQLIMVYPALDLVAVTTGREGCGITKLVAAIPETVTSPNALPPDPVGAAALASAVRKAATETPGEVSEPPPLASAVADKIYQFPPNALAVKSMSLVLVGSQPRYDVEFYGGGPDRPPERFTGALGLDGLYRKGMDTPFGPLAIRGHWLNGHVFEIERLNIGASEKSRKWTLSFDGNQLTLSGKNYIGNDVTVVGKQSE